MAAAAEGQHAGALDVSPGGTRALGCITGRPWRRRDGHLRRQRRQAHDVVTALEGHGFGLAWHEQKRDAAGNISFVRHTIMDSVLDNNAGGVWFTQPHVSTFADINQDGILDFLVGKRHHSHFQYTDPDNWGMPVLYVYKVVRNPKAPGGAEFDRS